MGGLLLALTDVYAVPVAIFVLLRVLTGWRLWPIAFLGNVIHLVLLPALALFALLIALKRWWRAAVASIGALALLWWYGVFFLPNNAPSCPDPCEPIRVLQFNIADGRWPSGVLIEALHASNADIITLQEVSPDQAAQIQAALSEVYPHQILNVEGGAGLISRYPISYAQPHSDLPGRSYLEANVAIAEKFVKVLVAHPKVAEVRINPLGYTSVSRDAFIALSEIANQGMPTILAGDFNFVDQSADYDLLVRAGLHDAFRETGWGFGWTYASRGAVPPMPNTPLLRIDYIWHTDDFRALRSWVGPDYGSDHLPLWAELVWTTP